MSQGASPKGLFVKLTLLNAVAGIAFVLGFADIWYLRHHRPHVIDRAAGFVTPYTSQGVTCYLSQVDVAILAGVFGLAVLLAVGGQIYLRNAKRRPAEAASR
jgi:hypothetical protein